MLTNPQVQFRPALREDDSSRGGADNGGYINAPPISVFRRPLKAIPAGRQPRREGGQLVRLLRAGEPVKMSKRSGDSSPLREVVDEVGKDGCRKLHRCFTARTTPGCWTRLPRCSRSRAAQSVFLRTYGHARAAFDFPHSRERSYLALPWTARGGGVARRCALELLLDEANSP